MTIGLTTRAHAVSIFESIPVVPLPSVQARSGLSILFWVDLVTTAGGALFLDPTGFLWVWYDGGEIRVEPEPPNPNPLFFVPHASPGVAWGHDGAARGLLRLADRAGGGAFLHLQAQQGVGLVPTEPAPPGFTVDTRPENPQPHAISLATGSVTSGGILQFWDATLGQYMYGAATGGEYDAQAELPN